MASPPTLVLSSPSYYSAAVAKESRSHTEVARLVHVRSCFLPTLVEQGLFEGLLSDLDHGLSIAGSRKLACNSVIFVESTLYPPFEMSFPYLLVICEHDFVYRRLSLKHRCKHELFAGSGR
jgi:hypothetical protein